MCKDIIGVIGLGYVGLPLARLFATKYKVIGYDISQNRVNELNSGIDSTLEIENDLLKEVIKQSPEDDNTGLFCTTSIDNIKHCNYYMVTVPTPIDTSNRPDLTSLFKSSKTIGGILKKGDIVVYESTVYPGVTEDECVPILEKESGLKFNKDFFVGYSPERINPGDKEHTIEKILKVTSGSTPETGKKINDLYSTVIKAGTYLAPSIKVAEAAKIIENSQRDINIAFVNELAKIFNLLDIDTHEVLKAAGTKWNFLPFRPGLVGGHCIGVDPFYLAQKAEEIGYHPEIILAGRRVNDSMGQYISNEVVKKLLKKKVAINGAKVLILGITFKENCSDVRNTKIVDIISNLKEYHLETTVFDPWANSLEVVKEYDIEVLNKLPNDSFEAIILGVAHKEFLNLDLSSLLNDNGFIYDVKGVLKGNNVYRL